jgi:hypothetical protein
VSDRYIRVEFTSRGSGDWTLNKFNVSFVLGDAAGPAFRSGCPSAARGMVAGLRFLGEGRCRDELGRRPAHYESGYAKDVQECLERCQDASSVTAASRCLGITVRSDCDVSAGTAGDPYKCEPTLACDLLVLPEANSGYYRDPDDKRLNSKEGTGLQNQLSADGTPGARCYERTVDLPEPAPHSTSTTGPELGRNPALAYEECPKFDYVRVRNPPCPPQGCDIDPVLTLAEIQIIDEQGVNVAVLGVANASSVQPPPVSFNRNTMILVDGSYATTQQITLFPGADEYITVSFLIRLRSWRCTLALELRFRSTFFHVRSKFHL